MADRLHHDPLVRAMLKDTRVRLVARPIDCEWTYSRKLPISVTGFRQERLEIYYGERSRLAVWLTDPARPARPLNERDWFARELLAAVHDYFHCWSWMAIHERVGPRMARLVPEDRVFCHLLTEAAATVALDYWYLCTLDFPRRYDLGSAVRTFSTHFHEDFVDEYRRFDSGLEVQSPRFFSQLARFYCDGRQPFLSGLAFERSALSAKWLDREVGYGRKQRRYAREWVSHLTGIRPAPADIGAPVSHEARWKRALMEDLGRILWCKVKDGKDLVGSGKLWPIDGRKTARSRRAPDFRFVNVGSLDGLDRTLRSGGGRIDDESERYLRWQILSRLEHLRCGPKIAEQVLGLPIERLPRLVQPYRLRSCLSVEEAPDVFLPN